MDILPATQSNLSLAIDILRQNNLPVDDINESTKLFLLYCENEITGTIGLEIHGHYGLLRSLSVTREKRKNGSGSHLLNFIEKFAVDSGVKSIYLLTTTASHFFSKKGYVTISRNAVVDEIKKTSEFSMVCPSSAIVMCKNL